MAVELTEHDLAAMRGMFGPGKGRRAKSDSFTSYVRDLNGADVDLILNPPNMGTTTPLVKRLRAQHHQLAMIISQGVKDQEAAAITGYSISRVSILKQDPAFRELIEFYKAQREMEFANVHKKLAGLGEAAVEELQERLEQDPDELSVAQLLRIGEFALDRSTAPPKTRADSGGSGRMPAISISFHSPVGQEPGLTIEATPDPLALPPAEDLP